MSSSSASLHLWWRILCLLVVFVIYSYGLSIDGVLLLSFKYSVLKDPLSVLENWNYNDVTPCSWKGVTCLPESGETYPRVTTLSLPNSQLRGSIPSDFGMIQFLQRLDLSNNSLNGSLPKSIFNISQLQFLDLSSNWISGELPETIFQPTNLQSLNLSDNALSGNIPISLTTLRNLTSISLKNNYLSGNLPNGFDSVQVLDLSSNLINGSLPSDFCGNNLHYFNISFNRLSGYIPTDFANKIPSNVKIDLSFNNLSGPIPESQVFLTQETKYFSGNRNLCGEPTKNPCPIPSSPASLPNVSSPTSPSAIAAIPRTISSNPDETKPGSPNQKQNGLKPATIVGIIAGDIVGSMFLALIFFYIYRFKKRKNIERTMKNESSIAKDECPSSSEPRGFTRWSCLRKRVEEVESSDTSSSATDEDGQSGQKGSQDHQNQGQPELDQNRGGGGTLVTVDREKELGLETLLKASAYILGASGSSIMYKAVLDDGTTLAVRRIGESNVERFKDFENQVRVVAKLVHPNLVRVRGFYWGVDEKLIIYDFVPNGSLANARYRKVGSSPCHLPWEARLKIAKGVARGLSYLHEKKHVHGNLKPSNILLSSDMEPKIGDFGLEKIVTGDTSNKAWGSARTFGSKRSTASRDSFHDLIPGPSPSPSPSSIGVSPYHAPESLRSLKPNPKWDVYSFGIILLELLTGKVVLLDESGQVPGLLVEDKDRVLRMVDASIRVDVEGKDDSLLACFKLGYSCVSPVPQKRPSMKETLIILEKFPCSSSSSYYYAH